MSWKPGRDSAILALIWLLGSAAAARAEIVMVGQDSGRNLEATHPDPAGLYRYEGTLGNFLGTPIAPKYFLSSAHVPRVSTFVYDNGTDVSTTYAVRFVASQGDLALYTITDDQAFRTYAPVFSGTVAPGEDLLSIGRGTARGAETGLNGQFQGWLWGANDAKVSWGTNTVDGIATDGAGNRYVAFAFDDRTNPNEAVFSSGDSGGGTFVFNPATNRYELAGVNFGVDDTYVKNPNGSFTQVNAALFDLSGYYFSNGDGTYSPYPAGASQSSYASEVNTSTALIRAVPEPSGVVLTALGVAALGGRIRRRPA